MKKDFEQYAKKCDKCQKFANVIHTLGEELYPITSPKPFSLLEIDVLDLLLPASSQKKFLLAATDQFTKWVEVEDYAQIKVVDLMKFVWKNIVCQFGVPRAIVLDNDPQFASETFQQFCSKYSM